MQLLENANMKLTDEEYQDKVLKYVEEYMHYNIPAGIAAGAWPYNTFVPPSIVKYGLINIRRLWNHTETSERWLNEWIDDLEKHKIKHTKEVEEERGRIMDEIKKEERRNGGNWVRVKHLDDYDDD